MSKDTVPWGNHRIPKEFVHVIEGLEKLSFVGSVGRPQFENLGKRNSNNTKLLGYCDNKKSYVVKLSGGKFKQELYLRVKGEYLQVNKNPRGYDGHARSIEKILNKFKSQ